MFLQRFDADCFPFLMQGIGGTGFCLVWAGRIENPHEEVTVDNRLHCLGEKRQGNLEARIRLHAVGI